MHFGGQTSAQAPQPMQRSASKRGRPRNAEIGVYGLRREAGRDGWGEERPERVREDTGLEQRGQLHPAPLFSSA